MCTKNIVFLFVGIVSFFNVFAQVDVNKRLADLKEQYFPNPAYYRYYSPGYGTEDINPYELNALITLEIREQIKKRLQKDKLFIKADRLITLIISKLLSEVDSEENAIIKWRRIAKKLGRRSDQFTKIQQDILDVSDQKIREFYSLAQGCKTELLDTIVETMKHRILTDHKQNDIRQCDQTETRSVNALKIHNIKMSVEDKYINIIKKAYTENPDCPILEQLKNYQIFNIGSFDNSKGAFIVHDIYDHLWFSIKLEDAGLFKKYSRLLLALGNPHNSDIFSREGELFATIASHFRWFHFAEEDYKPLLQMEDIISILENSKKNGLFTENQKRAYKLIKSFNPDSLIYKALPFVLSDMSIQMLKYIALNGFPKVLNELYQSEGYFDVFEAEHVAFVIETTDYLFSNYEHAIKVLLNITMWIENYLEEVALGTANGDLIVDLEEIEQLEDNSRFALLSAKKTKWMRENIGFEVVRYPVGQ